MASTKQLIILLSAFVVSCTSTNNDNGLLTTVAKIENRLDARFGVVIEDTEAGRVWEHNSTDRFPMASTFKTLACGALLTMADQEDERFDRRVVIQTDDLVDYSPVMQDRVGSPGVTLSEACEATLHTSDNTAANIVLTAIGGPQSLTSFLRSIGDDHTRLDRYETELNEAALGDDRDTTTPAAMVATMKKLLVEDDVLSPTSQDQLKQWLIGNRVADALLRAGIPQTWTIADRTGAAGNGTRAIAAIMWPPERKPVIVAIYITETDASFDERNKAIAEIGSAITDAISN